MQSGIPAFFAHRESVGIGRNSWSFLPIPELQTSHGCVNDHLQRLKKCKAEFLHFCTSGIAGIWWELEGIPCHCSLFRNYKHLMDDQMITYRAWRNAKRNSCILCTSGIDGNWWELVGIGRNSCSLQPIPELQISHGCVNDHLHSLKKCKAEFLHFLHIWNH